MKLSDEFKQGIHAASCPAQQGSLEGCNCNIKRWHDAVAKLETVNEKSMLFEASLRELYAAFRDFSDALASAKENLKE